MNKNIALTKTYDLMLWLFPQIGKFPREYKFILGDRIETTLLDLSDRLMEAQYDSKGRATILNSANLKLDKLRLLVRLTKDLKLISLKKYEFLARELTGIGSYIGSWKKTHKGRSSK